MKKIVFLAMLLCLSLAASVFAEPAQPKNVAVDVLVVDTQELIANDPTITIPTPTAANYNAGYTDVVTGQLVVRSNVRWVLSVKTESWGSPSGVNKALTDWQWKRQMQEQFTECSKADDKVVEGLPTSGTNVNINYRMKLDWENDAPGSYYLVQYYTLTKDS